LLGSGEVDDIFGMFHDLSNKAAVDSEFFSNFLTRPKCRKLMPKKSR
jgi:hypothetical protein